MRTLLLHPQSLRWRQAVAPLFVVSLLLTPLLVAVLGWWGVAHIGLYLLANLSASAITARKHGIGLLPILPVIFAIIHCSWGTGFLAGLGYWPWRRS